MRISHVIDTIDISFGGPSRSITHLASALNQHYPDTTNTIFTTVSDKPINFNSALLESHYFSSGFMNYSNKLKRALLQSRTDIFHGHGLWQMPVHHMASVARNREIPYIITPRGMLEPWPLKQKRLIKQMAMKTYQFSDIKNATCIHATAKSEAQNIRNLGFNNTIAIIPNGIILNDFPYREKVNTPTKTILFLSRVHKKKGIELLIDAWQNLDKSVKKGWEIKIVGNGEENYIYELKKIIKENNLNSEISIEKPIFGKKKIEAYHKSDIFVLPSFSENFGIVVAEALACGTPVITTKETPWQNILDYNCGKWIDIGVEPLAKALNELMQMSAQDRIKMGRNGRQLIQEKYTIEMVAKEMNLLYKYLLNQGNQPKSLYKT